MARQSKAIATTAEPDRITKLLDAAANPEIDLERARQLYDMVQKEQARLNELEFLQALNECQAEIQPIAKTGKNDQTKSRYATLDDILTEIRPIIAAHNLTVSFRTEACEVPDHVMVVGVLQHTNGHAVCYPYLSPYDLSGPQGAVNKTRLHASGSALTYAKRYILGGMFNLAYVGEDDDGQSDSTNPYVHGTWNTPDGSFQPPFRYALRWLGPTIDGIIDAIRAEDFPGAYQLWTEMTQGERLALKIAPTKKGPWPQDVWKSLSARGDFRVWMEEYHRKLRQEKEDKAHEQSPVEEKSDD